MRDLDRDGRILCEMQGNNTMDPLKAIDRIMESKGCILAETDEQKQLEYAVNLLRQIRQRKHAK